MAKITIKGVLRAISGIEGRSDLTVNRVFFYKKNDKEYAVALNDDSIVSGDNAIKGTSAINYDSATEVTFFASNKAYQKTDTGYFNERSIAGIYEDDSEGHTWTTNNHPNFTA